MKTIFILLGVILTSIFSVSDTFAGTNSKIYISEVVYDANYKTFDITYCSNWSGTLGATDINVKIVTPKVIRMTHRLEDGFWGMDECDVITI